MKMMSPVISKLVPTVVLCLSACSGADPLLPDASGDYQIAPDAVSCRANNDGEIALDELSFGVGARAAYRVNPPGTLANVDNAGSLIDGQQTWKHDGVDGVVANVNLESIEGMWFAQSFPSATFATGVTVKAEDLQVLELDVAGKRLLLLGIASRKPDQTLLVYTPPIELMRFPLRKGLKISSTGEVIDGKLNGLPIATKDTYEIEIDEEGSVVLPSLELRRTLRMRAATTVSTVGKQQLRTLQYQWFHECFGEVARSVAQPTTDGTPVDPAFNKATEYRRITVGL